VLVCVWLCERVHVCTCVTYIHYIFTVVCFLYRKFVARVQKGSRRLKSKKKIIKEATRLLLSEQHLCKLLTLYRVEADSLKLLIDCTEKRSVQKTLQKWKSQDGKWTQIPETKSSDMRLHNGERIVIDVKGNFRLLPDVDAGCYAITYMPNGDHHRFFPVVCCQEPHSCVGGKEFGIINYQVESGHSWAYTVSINTKDVFPPPAPPRKSAEEKPPSPTHVFEPTSFFPPTSTVQNSKYGRPSSYLPWLELSYNPSMLEY
jgi:hypothetical protein